MLEPVRVEVTVELGRDDAFAAFVTNIADWWPVSSHSIAQGLVHVEPKLGGRIIETSAAGEIHIWGHVTAWDRPHWIELAWYVGRTAQDSTQISVAFEEVGAGQARVTLVHSGWEVLGDSAAEMRTNYNGGWHAILNDRFAPYCRKAAQAGDA